MIMASKTPSIRKPMPPATAQSKSASHPRTRPLKAKQKDDIIFIDMDAAENKRALQRPSSSASVTSTSTRIDPSEILQENNETSPESVYEIVLHGSKIRKIERLDAFTKCRSLDLSSNSIENVENLKALRDLRELKLYDNALNEIKNLELLTELCNLQLQYNQISQIGNGLSKLKKLKSLRLDNNIIMEINVKELSCCFALTSLDLSHNQIQDITPLNCLPNLEELRVSHNKLKQVQDLTRCRKLEEIDLSGNKLVDVSGLKGLPSLSVLDLSKNLLLSLASTGSLKSLKDLNLSNNKFRDLTRLVTAFPELEVFKISNNRVEEWSQILKLADMRNLVELYIDGNTAFDAIDNHVAAVQEITSKMTNLDILNGAQIHRKTRTSAPLMRPMSANSIISVKQVEHQIRSIESEMSAFETDLSKKFEEMAATLSSLPARAAERSGEGVEESPRPLTASRQSRCSSRSKIKDAMTYASANFSDT